VIVAPPVGAERRDMNANKSIEFEGKRIAGKWVHARFAFANAEDWLSHFEATFPHKSKRMRQHSDSKGWSNWMHQQAWLPICIKWANKQ